MPKKIRVYELARELGISNKEALDLCGTLGIGVRSHSSSIEDAQADRVRRKAISLGLGPSAEQATSSTENRAPSATGRQGGAESASQTGRAEPPAAATATSPATGQRRPPVDQPRATGDRPEAAPQRGDGERRQGPEAPGSPARGGGSGDQRVVSSKPAAQSDDQDQAATADGGSRSQGRSEAPAETRQDAAGGRSGTAEGRPSERGAPPRQPADRSRQAPPAQSPSRRSEQPGGRQRPDQPADRRRSGQQGTPGEGTPARPAAAASGTRSGEQRSRPRDGSQDQSRGGSQDQSRGGSQDQSRGGSQDQSRESGGGRRIPMPPGGPPRSSSGKPIPPPPGGLPRSPATGKPIPPPPGMGGRGSNAPRTGGGAPPRPGSGRPGGTRPGTGGRPGVGDRPGPPRPGPGTGPRPGPGRGPGGPPGRGGPPPRGRPPQRRGGSRRRRRSVEELEPTQPTTYTPSNAPVPEGEVIVERASSAQDLGPKLNRSAGDVVRFLLLQGEMVTATQALSDEMIELFAAELGAQIRLVDPGQEQEAALLARYFGDGPEDEDEDEALLQPRPPVVTVMGHVDHGKTKLLDRIREANVVAGEAGGITQHIGAYRAEVGNNWVTFIDTPGHEAFTAMRARGAQLTDIVVLVVAADDGVMPQTVEAINHARAAEVPIVVAINKIDREDADPTRVMQQLSDQGLVPEAWGGDTIMVELSALQGIGVDDLLEHLSVLAEVLELRANPEGRARGVVLEGNLDVGRGPVATVVVERGQLDVGDSVVAGASWGRVKALIDDRGSNVKRAGPSTPVQVLGFSEVPSAGDEMRVTPDLQTARTIGEQRSHWARVAGFASAASSAPGAKLEDVFEQIQRGETATLNLIVKADVQGSLEAITEALRKLERDEVKLSFVHRAVGGITENDVQLAAASNATIIGFNVRPDRRARELAGDRDVEIRTYEIIYKVLEDIEGAMLGLLAPEYEEVVTGEAEVREVFRVPRVGAVAGCYVRNGVITRNSKVRFLREGVVIWKGTVRSLKRYKDDAREVHAGFECGIGLSDFQDLHQGDLIETYDEREVQRT